MKTYKNVYEKILDKDAIKAAFYSAADKKKDRRDVKRILEDIDRHVEILGDILEREAFEPGNHGKTIINQDNHMKVRSIIKPRFKYEQVVHHLTVGVLEPIIMKSLYQFVCGSVPERGPHYGKKYLEKWIKGYKGRKFYVLKMDIHHFYPTVNQGALIKTLGDIIKDDRMMRLIIKIISVQDAGIPIGYYTSPWFGNFFLSKVLDHWIKETLGVDKYIRYADDLVILDRNKKKLHRARKQIDDRLREYDMQLNEEWQVFRFEYPDKKKDKVRGRAIDFMGFVFHHNRTTIRKSNLKRIRGKANRIEKKEEGPTWHDATSMLSRIGWFKHTDTYGYFQGHIKSKVNVRNLKRKVGQHQRELNQMIQEEQSCKNGEQ